MISVEGFKKEYFDQSGVKKEYPIKDGYLIGYRILTENSMKEVVLEVIEDGGRKEVYTFTSFDSVVEIVKRVQNFPQSVLEEILRLIQ
ncbi:hypothetical protein HS7_09830 [Sulfolobales archaeon HS-7]|nr:hypothetical protein HS7_09830 [Sulfolobales archaeon HS-7]